MEQEVSFSSLKNLFEEFGSRVEIESPDGWVPILNYFDMGTKSIVIVSTTSHSLRCASSHLIETVRDGTTIWLLVNELEIDDVILTTSGPEPIVSIVNDGEEECFDIEVDHKNHRYWAEGISSHNCGKSHNVEQVLEKDGLFDVLGARKPRFEIIKGALSAVGLYCKLYEFSEKGCVIVFDDCDSVFYDMLSLNILKAALDSGSRRFISWNTDSRVLRGEGIPDRFEFKGAAIFITNINFANVRSKTLKDHLNALESRCHYIDLEMDTSREKMLRINQIVAAGMLDRYDFEHPVEAQAEILDFVTSNKDQLRELSLRIVIKTADLYKTFPTSWQSMARTTLMRRT